MSLRFVLAAFLAMASQPKLGSPGATVEGYAELEQSMLSVFGTPIDSVPGRMGFGSKFHLIVDMPMPVAKLEAVKEVSRCLAASEPRVTPVSSKPTTNEKGQLVVDVTWKPTTPLDPTQKNATRTTRLVVS